MSNVSQSDPRGVPANAKNVALLAQASRSVWQRVLSKPGSGAVGGAIAVGAFFSLYTNDFATPAGVANWLDPTSTLGIGAVPVAMLLIGGEFDLSAGVMIGSSGLIMGLLAVYLHLNVWLAMAGALCYAIMIGLVNGMMVVYTNLPSFIVTLGAYFVLQGLDQGVAILVTGNVSVNGISSVAGYSSAFDLLGSQAEIFGTRVYVAVFWWFAVTALGAFVLAKTRFGNWTLACGGDKNTARREGVAVVRTKVTLFVGTAVGAWLVGMITALRFTSVETGEGVGQELIYIVAAVVGGCLLTGGYGSIVGTAVGALIFGMAELGIPYAGWSGDWFDAFLGAALIVAVLINTAVGQRIAQGRPVRRGAERRDRSS